MTGRSLMTLCIVLFYVPVFSQVEWGVKCGFNLSNIVDKGNSGVVLGIAEERGTNLGLHLGFLAAIKINERFNFQPEIQFSQKGLSNKTRGTNLTLNYLEIPVMASVNVINPLMVEFGPCPSFLLSNSVYKTFDLGLSGGVQAKITNKLGIIVRYTHGLTKIAAVKHVDMNGNVINEYRQYNRCLQFGIVYKLKS